MFQSGNREMRDSGSAGKKGSSEPPFKRPRIETPSPLPTFKVQYIRSSLLQVALENLILLYFLIIY